MQLTTKQELGLKLAVSRYKHGEKFTVISGYAGSGKAQPINTIIPTPNGNVELGKIQVGDYVFDREGKPTKVLGVYPQGLKKKYKIVLSDKRETICAGDHLWSYYTSRGNLVSKTTEEILNSGLKNSSGFKYKIPINKPVQYSTKEYDIDPYLIGAFLGDGCCKAKYLTISSETEEIPNLIGEIINATPIKNSETNYNWTFEWNDKTKTIKWIGGNGAECSTERKKPKTLDYFEKYEKYLMQYAYEKDIPPEYKYGDVEQRLNLIQGLMDTDGSINSSDNHRYNMRFTSTSLKLVKSLQEILFSLGYSSTIYLDEREKKYTNNICYNLSINIPNEEKYKFFRLKRKKDIALEAQKYKKRKDYSKVSIVDIIPLKEMTEMVCIYVDNSEHLYLTNDYIVTHNTTLVKFIIDAIGLPHEDICYAAYTGKASEVLRKKGNPNAMTLHKLLYDSRPLPNGGFIRTKKIKIEYKLVVVDECSMVPQEMVEQLAGYYGVYVIYLGDPGQIPPIDPNTANHLLANPHVFLDEIMRQAQESEIIRLSMKIRNGEDFSLFDGKDAKVITYDDLNTGMLTWADIILSATNRTRHEINMQMRELTGHLEGKPVDGDKVICTRNYWEELGSDENPLINGSIGYLKDTYASYIKYPRRVNRTWLNINKNPVETLCGSFISETGEVYENKQLDLEMFSTGKPQLDSKSEFILHRTKFSTPLQFEYGYCVTGHKAQGSEWDNILVLEERFPFDKEEHARWLYTCVTRSSSKLVLVKGGV